MMFADSCEQGWGSFEAFTEWVETGRYDQLSASQVQVQKMTKLMRLGHRRKCAYFRER